MGLLAWCSHRQATRLGWPTDPWPKEGLFICQCQEGCSWSTYSQQWEALQVEWGNSHSGQNADGRAPTKRGWLRQLGDVARELSLSIRHAFLSLFIPLPPHFNLHPTISALSSWERKKDLLKLRMSSSWARWSLPANTRKTELCPTI